MTITVFLKNEILARGRPDEVAPAMRALQPLARSSDLLAFDDDSGRQLDLDLRAEATPAPRPRGRPALGVEAKEVTLLPRHWQWLARQRGGASATLRQLVEAAMREGRTPRECQDAAYRFQSVMAGDLAHYEDAIRALYSGNRLRFEGYALAWPEAIRDHARRLAWPGEVA